MSFKRDGDDKSLLGVLRQRRIRDLLAVDIPEDEALLTSNGRLSCTVCYHRPIFDTVEMLLVHRQGKKHAAGVAYKNQEKKEIQNLILKRKHEKYLKDGTTDIPQADDVSSSKNICLGAAYDSRCQRKKAKQPKMKLNLSESTVPTATSINMLPGNKVDQADLPTCNNKNRNFGNNDAKNRGSTSYDGVKIEVPRERRGRETNSSYNMILEKQMEGPVMHSHQLKQLFVQRHEGPVHVKPYQSKRPRVSVEKTGSSPSNWYTDHRSDLCRNDMLQKQNVFGRVEAESSKGHIQSNTASNQVNYSSETVTKTKVEELSNEITKTKRNMGEKEKLVHNQENLKLKVEKAEKYLYYRGAGWKKDLFGNWVKDEEAEFDSDEEPPNLP